MNSVCRTYAVMGVMFSIGVTLPLEVIAAHKEIFAKAEASSNQMTKEDRKALGKELRDLARSGDEASFAELAHYATNKSPDMRKAAAIALGRSKNKEAVELLLTLAHDGDQNVRGAAMLGLGMQSDPKAYTAVVEALETDESSEVKGRAAFALGGMKDEKAQAKLLECLKNNLTAVRQNAAMALGKADDTRVIEPLIKALGDPEDGVRNNAAKSLKILTAQDAIYEAAMSMPRDEAQRAWQDWWDRNKKTFKISTVPI